MTLYMPPTFLTVEVLEGVLSQFQWPAPYTVRKLPVDSVAVQFPKCTLVFIEGFESDMEAKFLPRDTGLENTVAVYELLYFLGGPDTPGLLNFDAGGASLEKVQKQSHDLCAVVLHHFRSSLLGDFRWVPAYREYLERSRERNP
jgi:hypothetical protein